MLQTTESRMRKNRSLSRGTQSEWASLAMRRVLSPRVNGEQWNFGAVSTAEWTGVPLVEILDRANVKASASEIVFRGADSGKPDASSDPILFERSLSIENVQASEVLLAYAMNGEALPIVHGYPLRVVVPGWYAVASVKWLTEIEVVGGLFSGHYQTETYFFEWQRGEQVVRERYRCSVCGV